MERSPLPVDPLQTQNSARNKVAMALQAQRGLQKPSQAGNLANDLLQVWNMKRNYGAKPPTHMDPVTGTGYPTPKDPVMGTGY